MNEAWELESAVARHEAHPDTFWIPSEEERMALAPGHGAKLLFVLPEGLERMWVAIAETQWRTRSRSSRRSRAATTPGPRT